MRLGHRYWLSRSITTYHRKHTQSKLEGVEIRLLSKKDFAETEKNFKEQFCLREPPARHLQVAPDDWMGYLKPLIEDCLNSETSFGAFDKTSGVMSGVTINFLGRKQPQPDLQHEFPLRVKQLFRMLSETNPNGAAADLGTSNFFEMYLISVMDGYDKRGIGMELTQRNVQRARELDCEFVIAVCTSAFSRTMLEKLGFTINREVVYEDYVDPITGEKVMKGMTKPHYASTLMSLKL